MSGAVKQLVTAEELWEMPEVPGVAGLELVDGEVVEVPGAGAVHALIVRVVFKLLDAYVESHRLGIVMGDSTSYILQRDPDTVRIPDISFLSNNRLPKEPPSGYWEVAPDLAVEIVSPGNSASELRRKIRDYLDAGVRHVWVLWPDDQSVTVYTPGSNPQELESDDMLDGGDVLPGFGVQVAELFQIEW